MNDELQQPEAIAVIGMDGRFPGAADVQRYWDNLVNGADTIQRFSRDELDPAVAVQERESPNYVPVRGQMPEYDRFDAEFFGISPRDAEMLDPQHRVFLEMVWRALEDAGYAPGTLARELVGVYAGMSYNTYFSAHVARHPEKLAMYGEIPAMVANEKDYLATRAAYKFDLRGPAVNISTACSTSLVAVCHAFSSLLEFQCDIAVAGGISITCPAERGYVYTEGSIYSPDGKCRPFDVHANGTVFSSGGGVVVLKRLSEALADGDTIHAVIRGAAMNNDGADKVSFTAPSVNGQADVVQMAQEVAGVKPQDIDYIETHGTGTTLGDPIEIAALTQAFRTHTPERGICGIGSAKANIGHLDAASGIAGLIKTVLALREKKLPPTLNFQRPNPDLGLEDSPFHVVDSLRDWPDRSQPRRAAVSSFGLGGTNAHVILEEAPQMAQTSDGRSRQLLTLSAKSEAALQRAADAMAEHIGTHPEQKLADVAWTLQTGRQAFEHRLALVACDQQDAAAALRRKDMARVQQRQGESKAPGVIFMFPGQGSQFGGMGEQLYEEEPRVREIIDKCADALRDVLEHDLRDVMFDRLDNSVELLDETGYTQPALFALELALAQLWRDWGVQPAALLGHSIGEYVGATIAGVFQPDDAIRVVAERGRLMQEQDAGSMLSVRLSESVLQDYIVPGVSIAAVNAPELCVLSGRDNALSRITARLEKEGVRYTRLRTSHAFHSELMEPALEPFAEFLRAIDLAPPQLDVISTLTGEPLTAEQAIDPEYWVRQLREPVRFHAALKRAHSAEPNVFLECGPGIAGSTFAGQTFADDEAVSVAASFGRQSDEHDEVHALLHAAGRLWVHGVKLDWRALHEGESRRRIPLPTYRFERTRYWLDSTGKTAPASAPRESSVNETVAQPQGSPLERVQQLLCEVTGLQQEKLSAEKSFTDLGLDSLALTQFSQLLRKRFGVDIKFRQLLEEYGTLVEVAELLTDEKPPGKAQVRANGMQEHKESVVQSARGDSRTPPRPDARLGRRPDGQPAWFIPDPKRPGRYRELRTR